MRPKSLVEKHARRPDKASLFNHASMAYNNHEFFSSLSPRTTEPSTNFLAEINDSFSSYETLRTEMIETADSMFGPGFVWIVKDGKSGRMHLLCTYLAGTPLPAAHARAQQIDSATNIPYPRAQQQQQQGHLQGEPTNRVGAFGSSARASRDNYYYNDNTNNRSSPLYGGYNAKPVLCVNTWQHVYLRDYGVAGKRQYLERWWDHIDWELVERNAKDQSSSQVNGPLRRTMTQSFSRRTF